MRFPAAASRVGAPPRGGETLGALKVVVSYAAFACLWILLSDELVASLVKDPATMTAVSILKGSLFVAITSLLLFFMVRRFGGNLAARDRDLLRRELERVRASQALEESEKRFITAFQLVPVGLAISRLDDGQILTVNEAFLGIFGLTLAETAGNTSLALGIWAAGTRADILDRLSRGEALINLELPAQRQDGTPLHIAYSGRLVEMQGEACLLSVAVDVTAQKQAAVERQQLETELQHAQKLESLGSLASGVAHDMNNVLAAIQTMAEVLQERVAADPGLTANIDTISRAARRGRDLVRGLTNFARKDLREPQMVDLNRVVAEEAELLDRILLQKVRLVLELEPGLASAMGEAGSLGAALMNLCVNAVDAMPEGGTLTLSTRGLADGWIELGVSDTGTGMSPEVTARALEPFFTTKAPGKGTGLGLAMVHGTVKAHGGTLQVQSSPSQGTRISVRLPAVTVPAEPVAALVAPASVAGRQLEILLVDDDELIRAAVPAMLELDGHRVVSAAGGREALALLQGGLDPDLVILDLNMPEMSGAETLTQLRVLRPDQPVLVATGFLDQAMAERIHREARAGVRTGALAKPFSKAELVLRIRELCP